MTFHSNLLTLAGVQMHNVQLRRRWGGGLWREQALLNIYSEQKLQWRCRAALGTEFASEEGAFTRSGWDGLCAATVFNACGGFFFPKSACLLFEAKQTLSAEAALRQGAPWFDSMSCKEIVPIFLSPPPISSTGWSLLEKAVSPVRHFIASPWNLGCGGPMWQTTCLCGMS